MMACKSQYSGQGRWQGLRNYSCRIVSVCFEGMGYGKISLLMLILSACFFALFSEHENEVAYSLLSANVNIQTAVLIPNRILNSFKIGGQPNGTPVKNSLQTLLNTGTQGPLFAFLFSDEFKKEWQQNKNELLSLLNQRLFEAMPTQEIGHRSRFQNELRLRMGILQAVNQLNDTEAQPLLVSVLKSNDQHWLLRWLSLRGLQQMPSTNRENFFNDLYQDLDPQIIQLAQISEEEMLDRIVSNE